jgi:hypothetical protein
MVHLGGLKERSPKMTRERDMELRIAGHFREEAERLAEQNKSLIDSPRDMHAKVDRLTSGLERLVGEMHGIRTGKRMEAFARVGAVDMKVDLQTVRSVPAGIYTVTAKDVGEELGFRPSEIGLLLGSRGLRWADNSDYQETIRRKRPTQQRFWVYDMALRLAEILTENQPGRRNITDKAVLAIFRNWQKEKAGFSQELSGQ